MAYTKALFTAEFEPAIVDRLRRSMRAPVSLNARIERGGLNRALCKVTDLSQMGARLQTYSALRRGMVIWLTLPTIGQVAATIRWADDFAAGCEFVQPITNDQFETLIELGGIDRE